MAPSGIRDTEPAAAWPDAFLAGNGRHGAMAHGDPRDETVIVTHHHLVAPNGSAALVPPPLAARLGEVRDLLLAGRSGEARDRFCDGWPENAPQPFHPAFAIRLRLRPARGPVAGYQRSADFGTGVLTTSWRDAAGEWRRTCFVSRARDVVVQQLELPPGTDADLEVGHEVRLPGAPDGLAVSWLAHGGRRGGGREGGGRREGGREGGGRWEGGRWEGGRGITVGLRVRYPDNGGHPGEGAYHGEGGYCGATRIETVGGDCVPDGPLARIRSARAVLLLTRVVRLGPEADPEASLGALIRELSGLPDDHRVLLAEHVRRHRRAFGRTRLDLRASAADRRRPVAELLSRQAAEPDRPLPALLEKLFDSGRYLLLSASGLLPPRLTGLWQGDWHAAWSGAIVTNANLNLQLAGAVTADVPAAIGALADLVTAQLADWRVNAARLFGTRGILAPAHTDGSSGLNRHFGPAYPHQMWTAGADWLLVPLLDYVHASGNIRFHRERVAPVLLELARFYEDFLVAARPGDDADLMLVPSYSPENRPAGWSEAAVNATMDIAAARHALTAACDWRAAGNHRAANHGATNHGATNHGATNHGAASADGPDRGPRRWRALLARLPAYQVNSEGALAEWAWPPGGPPLPDSYDHRHVSHLYPVWPLHEITVDDTPELAAAARQALRLRTAENGAAHGHLHQALAAARLRDAGLAGRKLAALTGGGFFFRSLMSSHYPGLSVYNADAACALPGLLLEMLVDSVPPRAGRPARVELLPALPAFLPAGRLRGARTLAGVAVDLTWDLPAGLVKAALRSRIRQQIELICRAAAACTITAASTTTASTTTAVGRAPAVAAAFRPGVWRLDLPAGTPVRVTLEVTT